MLLVLEGDGWKTWYKTETVVYCLVFLYAVYSLHGKWSSSYLLRSYRINNGCKLGTLQCRISSIILGTNQLNFRHKEKHILIIFIKKSLDTIKLCDVLYVSILFFHLHLKTPLLTYLTGPSTIKFLISGSKHNYKGRIFKHDSYTTPVQNQLSISIQLFCAKHYHLNKTVYLGSRSSHSC